MPTRRNWLGVSGVNGKIYAIGGFNQNGILSTFMEGVAVTIGENRVQQLDLFSPTELRLRTPPGTAGTKSVSVKNPDGQEAVKEDGFAYNPAPTISSISPNAGPLEGGTPIGAARQIGSNEVKWVDPDVYAGLYIYILEAELEGGKKRQIKNVMEVVE